MPDTEIADDIRMVLRADEAQWLQNGPKSLGGLFQRSADELERLQAEVRRLREREAKLRELHKPHGIYDECGHQHTEEDEILGIVDAGDAGLSCKKMYDVCTVCCDVADDGCQGETCVCDHDHSTDLPICKTREILDA